ncbi:hypothetical protein F2P81_011199 [Scophthalmus maximus]|uniref:Sushi domain-containing protein n=1 Tax=Scophthalmus maximus TaxID=52904 RepID=A0A6A4SR69_SCOMX|nr:hypothetical protein F2P81_011199 [Scophthalmus maximus]
MKIPCLILLFQDFQKESIFDLPLENEKFIVRRIILISRRSSALSRFSLIALCLSASLQLQCDKGQIAAHIGGEFILSCKYDTNHFLFSKKYWCRGDSRGTCEILADSEHVKKNSGRFLVLDARRKGLFVKVTGLQLDDTGVYWVGIDKIYADIMTSVNVFITEEGTDIRYAWYQRTHHKDLPVHPSSDLYLHCGSVEKGSDYYCVASNDISTEESEILSVQDTDLVATLVYAAALGLFCVLADISVRSSKMYQNKTPKICQEEEEGSFQASAPLGSVTCILERDCVKRDCVTLLATPILATGYSREEEDRTRYPSKETAAAAAATTAAMGTLHHSVGKGRLIDPVMGITSLLLMVILDLVTTAQVMTCDPPDPIAHGTFSPEKEDFYEYSQVVEFRCLNDYTLRGSKLLTCSEDGNFKPDPPACVKVECNDTRIENGDQDAGSRPPHRYQATMTFQCRPGYVMFGERTQICGIDSKWSPGVPECKYAPRPTDTAETGNNWLKWVIPILDPPLQHFFLSDTFMTQ